MENKETKIGGISAKAIDEMPSVFLAIPNMGTIQTELVLRTISWIYGSKVILFPPQKYSPVSLARNLCVEEFLRQDYDYLFFVDADTVPPPDAINNLEEGMKPVVQKSGIEEVDAFGMSCCMMHKSIFDGWESPWFTEKFVPEKGEKAVGEDILFCKNVAKRGIPLFADFSIHCAHHKMTKITFPNEMEIIREDSAGNEVRDVNISQ